MSDNGRTGLLPRIPKKRYIEIRSEYCKMLGGDHKAAAILYALGFRANLEVDDIKDDDLVPDDVTFSCAWDKLVDEVMLSMFSGDTVQHRLEYLMEHGFISFDIRTGGRKRSYVLHVGYTTDCLYKGKVFPPPPGSDYYVSGRRDDSIEVLASPEILSSQSGNPDQLDRKTGLVPLYIKEPFNEPFNPPEKDLLNPFLESKETTDPEEPTTTVDSTDSEEPIGGLDLDSPIEEFYRNQIRNIAKVKPPNLKTRVAQPNVERLHQKEKTYGIATTRQAFIAFCEDRNPELKKAKYPLNWFIKHIDRYLAPGSSGEYRFVSARSGSHASARQSEDATHQKTSTTSPPVPNAQEFISTWDRIVTERPHTGRTPDFPRDPEFTMETWERACQNAAEVIRAKGEEVSWMVLPWMLGRKENRDYNWRRMADGEFKSMAVPRYKSKAERDSGVSDGFIERWEAEQKRKEQERQEQEDL